MVKLPNLELLEYKASLITRKDKYAMEKIENHYKERGYRCFANNPPVEFDVQMFPQTWGSTCTGFDVCSDGTPAMGGQAITKEYTTIFFEPISKTYFVFFGDRFCYLVQDANKVFLKDLQKKNLKPLSQAKLVY